MAGQSHRLTNVGPCDSLCSCEVPHGHLDLTGTPKISPGPTLERRGAPTVFLAKTWQNLTKNTPLPLHLRTNKHTLNRYWSAELHSGRWRDTLNTHVWWKHTHPPVVPLSPTQTSELQQLSGAIQRQLSLFNTDCERFTSENSNPRHRSSSIPPHPSQTPTRNWAQSPLLSAIPRTDG